MPNSHIFISYRSQDPDRALARDFYQALRDAGHHVFLAGESLRLGDDWPQRIEEELRRCDYFLLFLSPKAVASDMVIEEVQRAKHLQDSRPDGRPRILPIRVMLDLDEPLTYDLSGYLGRIQQRVWTSAEHTASILSEVLSVIEVGESQPDHEHTPGAEVAIEKPEQPPLPVAPPELPEGQVDIASAFYVARPTQADELEYYAAIERPGALISIKAPRQMGKTSLMSRILYHARQMGYRTLPITFQLVAESRFSDIDTLMQWFCSIVGRMLGMPNQIEERRESFLDAIGNANFYFEEYILKNVGGPLVLGLDEVDRLFSHPSVSAEFLGVLRAWNESAKGNDVWKDLRIIIAHSTESYVTLPVNQSPFNVGLPIRLPEFTAAQVKELALRHGLGWGDGQVSELMRWVGGHPYLVRSALYYLARKEVSFSEFVETAPTEEGRYSDHLRRHLWNLQKNNLSQAMKRVVDSRGPTRLDSLEAFKLEAMGLVERDGNNVSVTLELYREYFKERL